MEHLGTQKNLEDKYEAKLHLIDHTKRSISAQMELQQIDLVKLTNDNTEMLFMVRELQRQLKQVAEDKQRQMAYFKERLNELEKERFEAVKEKDIKVEEFGNLSK